MREPFSTPVLLSLQGFSCVALALVGVIFSGCGSVNDGGEQGYYSGPELTPVQGAVMMQDRLGQIARAQIR